MSLGLSSRHSRPKGLVPVKRPSRCREKASLHGGEWAACLGCMHAVGPASILLPWEPLEAMAPHVFEGTCPALGATDGQSVGGRGSGPTYQGKHTSRQAPCPQGATSLEACVPGLLLGGSISKARLPLGPWSPLFQGPGMGLSAPVAYPLFAVSCCVPAGLRPCHGAPGVREWQLLTQGR